MTEIAATPKPPYYAVIFTSHLNSEELGYASMAERMIEHAEQQPGFLGVESARNELGITVSYWSDLESIEAWKANAEHQRAQRIGRQKWYASFSVRIARVERDYAMANL